MLRIPRFALTVVFLAGLFFGAGLVLPGHGAIAGPKAVRGDSATAHASASRSITQVPVKTYQQTAQTSLGTILLSVIPRIGAAALKDPIDWKILTYGRNAAGNRVPVTEVTGATPRLVLPAGWYVVHAYLADQVIRHPIEVTAGRTFKYTLVKN